MDRFLPKKQAINKQTQTKDITGALYEHIMQDTDISRQSEEFRSEARRLAELITSGQSIFQALQTVDNLILREKLRPFMYATMLRTTVAFSLESGNINQLQHDDLRAFLLDLGNV